MGNQEIIHLQLIKQYIIASQLNCSTNIKNCSIKIKSQTEKSTEY